MLLVLPVTVMNLALSVFKIRYLFILYWFRIEKKILFKLSIINLDLGDNRWLTCGMSNVAIFDFVFFVLYNSLLEFDKFTFAISIVLFCFLYIFFFISVKTFFIFNCCCSCFLFYFCSFILLYTISCILFDNFPNFVPCFLCHPIVKNTLIISSFVSH